MAYGTGAEFYGMSVPDPEPKPVVKAAGLRKFYHQALFRGEDVVKVPGLTYRAEFAAQQSMRALDWFAEQERSGVKIHWHTLEMRVLRNGMETSPDQEEWRWEVWAE